MTAHYTLAIITLTLAQFLAAATLRGHPLNPDDMYSELVNKIANNSNFYQLNDLVHQNYANTRTGYMPSWPLSREFMEERELVERELPRVEKLQGIEEAVEDAPQETLPVPSALIGEQSKSQFMKKDPGYRKLIRFSLSISVFFFTYTRR